MAFLRHKDGKPNPTSPCFLKSHKTGGKGLIGIVRGIEFGFNFLEGGPGIGHDKIGAFAQFLYDLVSSAFGPSFFSGRAVKLFIDLAVGFADENPVVEKRAIVFQGAEFLHGFRICRFGLP